MVNGPESRFYTEDTRWMLPANQAHDARSILLTYAKTKLIPELEIRYGARHPDFNLKGLEFGNVDCPRTEYPPQGNGDFSIWLTTDCSRIPVTFRAVFQLAHECLHALQPVPKGDATVLEEGLATDFSMEAMYPSFSPSLTRIFESSYYSRG